MGPASEWNRLGRYFRPIGRK